MILKPFLLFFDYADLRVINVVLEMLLVFGIWGKLTNMGHRKEAWGYIISILFVMPVVIPLSLQFSVIFYLTNIAVLVLLKEYDWLVKKNDMLLYFQLIGMATSFFDLLTYPIASLGVPMVCLQLIDIDSDLWIRCKKIVVHSVSWGFGYVAMWAGKWVLSTLILRENILANALSQILMRSSHTENCEELTMFDTWLRNVEFYFEKPYLLLIVACLIIAIIGIVRNRGQMVEVMIDNIPFVVIALMPFVWYAFIRQHSYEHHWFTFRGLMTSVFSCMCICARLYRKADAEQPSPAHH